jgi:superfamily I DNA/RNA helicase
VRGVLESYEWVRRAVVARFLILAVDEYQDLRVPLHRMVINLCFGAGSLLFAVGDADQSIYGFTGARPELLRQLSERDGVTAVTLPFNYRSAPEIVAAGEAVIGEPGRYTSQKTARGLSCFSFI